MVSALVLLVLVQQGTWEDMPPEPEHVGYLLICPLTLCWMGGMVTGATGLAFANANFPPYAEDSTYSFFRHTAMAITTALSASLGASLVAYPMGGMFDIPRSRSFGQTFAGGLAGGLLGFFLIPPSLIPRPSGKILVLMSSSFFASVGAALAYDWSYVRGTYTPEPSLASLRLYFRF